MNLEPHEKKWEYRIFYNALVLIGYVCQGIKEKTAQKKKNVDSLKANRK